MHKGRTFIQKLKIAINNLLMTDMGSKQRVGTNSVEVPPQIAQVGEPIERITMAPPILKTRDPTVKRNLIKTTRTHQRKTRRNTPGALPAIRRVVPTVISPDTEPSGPKRQSTRVRTQATDAPVNCTPKPVIILPPYPVPRTRASTRIISQQALNAVTMREAIDAPRIFTPQHFVHKAYEGNIPNYAHFALPMVHPPSKNR